MTRLHTDIITEMQVEMLKREKNCWFRVLSNSMLPLIRMNDMIFVTSITPSEARTGDIVLFRTDGVFVAHRLVQTGRERVSTLFMQKGDASRFAGSADPESIVGRVIAVEKNGRILDLTRGRGKALNAFLMIKNNLQILCNARFDRLKQKAKNIPGYAIYRACYRSVRKPLGLIQWYLVDRAFSRTAEELRAAKKTTNSSRMDQ